MNRGRFSNPSRGRSPSRGSGFRGRGRLGFFAQATQQEEKAKIEAIKDDVADLKQYALKKKSEKEQKMNTSNENKIKTKIDSTIEAGKEFISKFFRGFTQPDRGNVRVTMSSTLSSRLAMPYYDRIKTYADFNFQHDAQAKFEELSNQFRGIVEIGMAIKLHRSATDFEKNLNYKFTSIRNLDIPLPKRMNILMNQLGKTDLQNDNRIRLKYQHLLVKRFLLRGACGYLGNGMDEFLNQNYSHTDVLTWMNDKKQFDRMIDVSTSSLALLKSIGREYFEDKISQNVTFQLDGEDFILRMPNFNFHEGNTVLDITTYFSNRIFRDFTFDQNIIHKIIASLVYQVARYNWLQERTKTMEELDAGFKNTIVAKYRFEEILRYTQIEFIDEFIDNNTLDDVINLIIGKWKSSHSSHFYQMFNMEEVKFSEFGSDAQIVEIKQFKQTNDMYGGTYDKIVNRSPAETILKTSDHGAIVGLMLAYSEKVEFSSKFQINFDSKNDQILNEFVKNDFKI